MSILFIKKNFLFFCKKLLTPKHLCGIIKTQKRKGKVKKMSAYWMNELVYAGVTCPVWLAWGLVGLVAAVVIAGIAGLIWFNNN